MELIWVYRENKNRAHLIRRRDSLPTDLPSLFQATVLYVHQVGKTTYRASDTGSAIFLPTREFHDCASIEEAVAKAKAFYGSYLEDLQNKTVDLKDGLSAAKEVRL